MSAAWFVVRQLARDRSALLGLILIAVLVSAALLAPVLATHPDDVLELHPAKRLKPPGAEHWLGTDRMGADVYSRLLFGARITILIGVIAVGASLLIGVPIGLVAGHFHGWFSDLLMRASDIFLAVPQVVLAIAIAQTLGPSLPNVILALSVTYWPWFARVVYAETRVLQKEIFVESTAALGASPSSASGPERGKTAPSRSSAGCCACCACAERRPESAAPSAAPPSIRRPIRPRPVIPRTPNCMSPDLQRIGVSSHGRWLARNPRASHLAQCSDTCATA